VRDTLQRADLIEKPRKKPKRNVSKPRFFERSTPNQLWQTDICTFRLGGKNAYLIAFMDDYSRYITGLGLYRSQTAEHVLEVYRTAIAEYNVPKEMLTDNGRQYTNWRGTTRFEYELKKDRVKHIKSRPHHPMTLGKVERFWKTILNEFMLRVQFGSFEEARERTALWIKYYNYKRPHQGIGGLCPADRFFEIQHELKKTLERGIEENTLEMALRGKPRDPFYMVGRMGGQSVVIRAEKGKVKMLLDEAPETNQKELVYDMQKGDSNHESQTDTQVIQHTGENKSGTIDMDGASVSGGSLPGPVNQLLASGQVAEPGHGGDDDDAGRQDEGGASCGAERPSDETPGEEGVPSERQPGEAGGPVENYTGAEEERVTNEEEEEEETGAWSVPAACGSYYEGALWFDDGDGGGKKAGGIP
jgi:hypothetical protein